MQDMSRLTDYQSYREMFWRTEYKIVVFHLLLAKDSANKQKYSIWRIYNDTDRYVDLSRENLL
jgi:hypothetical protein